MQRERDCVSKQDLTPGWTALESLLCGAFAGAVAKTVIAPLDRTKIIFQGKNDASQTHFFLNKESTDTQWATVYTVYTCLQFYCVYCTQNKKQSLFSCL